MSSDVLLHAISRCSDEGSIRKILKKPGIDPNARDSDGSTPLHRSCHNVGQDIVVKLLIESGANVDAVNNKGCTPLHWAASWGNTSVARLLVESGARTDVVDGYGRTPLSTARKFKKWGVVEVLEDAEAGRIRPGGSVAPTALHDAAGVGDDAGVRSLLKKKVDVHATDSSGRTALHIASAKGHDIIAGSLILKGAKVKAEDKHGASPLALAAENGHVEMTRLLVDVGADVNDADRNGKVPLYWAAYGGHLEVAKLLIDGGANNLDVAADSGRTPLHASAFCGHDKLVQLLLDRGATVNVVDYKGDTPLHDASRRGNTVVIQLLVDCGANLNIINTDGDSPLHLCVYNGHSTAALLLAERGAEVIVNKAGSTPLDVAKERKDTGLVALLEARTAAAGSSSASTCIPSSATLFDAAAIGDDGGARRFLQDPNVDINATNEMGWTVLHACSMYGHYKIAEMLINKGANICEVDHNGWAPLHSASCYGHDEVVEVLLENGSIVDAINFYGRTALHLAAYDGRTDAAKVLLKQGADANAADDDGCTPLHLNSFDLEGRGDLARLLIRCGANVDAVNKDNKTPLQKCALLGNVTVARVLIDQGADADIFDRDGLTAFDIANANFQADMSKLLEDLQAGRIIPGQASKLQFIEALEEVWNKASKDESDSGPSIDLVQLLDNAIESMEDFLQLKLFYTASNACKRLGIVSKKDQSTLLVRALERARDFCESPYHTALYHTVLEHAAAHGIVDDFKKRELACGAIETQMMKSDGIRYMLAMIQANTSTILDIKAEIGNLRSATFAAVQQLSKNMKILDDNIHQLHSDVSLVGSSLSSLRKGMLYKQRIKAVGSLVSSVLNAISFGAAGSAIQGVLGLTLERIVDFGDFADVSAAIASSAESLDASTLDSTEQTTLHDTLLTCNQMAIGAVENRRLNEALDGKNAVLIVAAVAKMFSGDSNTLSSGTADFNGDAQKMGGRYLAESPRVQKSACITNDAQVRDQDQDQDQDQVADLSSDTFDEEGGRTPGHHRLNIEEWDDIVEIVEERKLDGEAEATLANEYIKKRGEGYEGGYDYFIDLVERSVKRRFQAKLEGGASSMEAAHQAAHFFTKRAGLLKQVKADPDGVRSNFAKTKISSDRHRRGVSMDPDGLRSSALHLRTNTCI